MWIVPAAVAAVLATATAATAAPVARAPLPITFDMAAPRSFGDSCCLKAASGSWLGPAYTSGQSQAPSVRARLDWSFRQTRAASVEGAVRSGLTRGWFVVEGGVSFLNHVVGGHRVGTVPASFLLAQQAGTPRQELVLAVPVHGTAYGRLRLEIGSNPPADRSQAGTLAVDGIAAGEWNRARLLETMRTIALAGNMPPSRITLRRASGRWLGAVADDSGHPLADVKIALQRKQGARWVEVDATRSTARGAFRVAGPRAAGVYRVAATVAGVTARSPGRAIDGA
ncbi:MAG TPA: hypothetical protein VJ689_09630, partial [Gaiellaceae bacterium]|nr:hypothetical protein [Gaiellaceae bacterium]